MNIGIYGAGHLTRSLLKGLEFVGLQNQILLYNRTVGKAITLKSDFPKIQIVKNLCDIVEQNSFVFVVIPPTSILDLPDDFITKIKDTRSILVSCANYITLDNLNDKYPKIKIIRLLPNILWQIACGSILYSINKEVEQDEKQLFLQLMYKLGDSIEIEDERDFDRFGKITTCGPGVFSKLISLFINELTLESDYEKEILIRCFLSTLRYSISSTKSFETIIEEVANKGGLTECAVSELNKGISGKFSNVFKEMDKKIVNKRIEIMSVQNP